MAGEKMLMSAVDENSSLVLSMACKTDVGRTRMVNQDAFIMCNLAEPSVQITEQIEKHPVGDEGFLLAVADGMGGAAAGEVASKVAVEQIARKLSAPSQKSDMAERIADGLRSAHRAVRHASLEDERRAG